MSSRLQSALRLDLRLYWRYGFYYAAAFTTLVWIAFLRLLPDWSLAVAVPLVIFCDLGVVGFYFMGVLVLYDRGEATLAALAVTPLRFWEYLAARLMALTGLALVLALAVVAATIGAGVNTALLLLGVLFTSLIASLAGFIAVAPFSSISGYLIPSGFVLLVLGLPVIYHTGWWESPLFYLLPTNGAMLLLRGAWTPVEPWQVLYAVVYQLVWVALLARWARWAYDRFILRRRGGG
jgi:fluoroquinolone transport system permease protein